MGWSSLKIKIAKVRRLLFEMLTSSVDFILWVLHFPVKNPGGHSDGTSVIFLGESLPPRISRLAKWLKRSQNYRIILCAHRIHFVKHFAGDEWDVIYLYRNKYHLRRMARHFNESAIIHAYAPKSYYPDLVRGWVDRPFIIDYQDVYASYYGENPEFRWLQKELPHEKNCLLHSDGIVAHSLEPNVVLRRYNATKPPALFFPLYCDNDQFITPNKVFRTEDIHLVYAGGVAGSFRNKAHFGSIMFHDLIKTLSEQKIHFHIYPSPANFKGDFDEYKAIDEVNPWFHFHDPVAQDQLHKELAKYHFGIIPFFKKDAGLSLEKTKYATALKLFNYIEAGLPVIVARDVYYQSWITERYHAGIAIQADDIRRIREIIEGVDYEGLVAALIANREKISLKKHIPRLVQFYQQFLPTLSP